MTRKYGDGVARMPEGWPKGVQVLSWLQQGLTQLCGYAGGLIDMPARFGETVNLTVKIRSAA